MTKANKTTSSVKIVDDKLILSLPDAKEPVVWQMDLTQAQAAAFTVKEDKKDKVFNLVFKLQGEKQETIAPYEDRQSAVDVLMETSQTLQNAQSKIKDKTIGAPSVSENEKGDKLGAVLAIILIILLFLSWVMFSSAPQKLAGVNMETGTYGNAAVGNPREAAGVPVSADDFLSNR
jgi:ATP-dependent Zn protease